MADGMTAPFERPHPQYWWNPAISGDPYWRAITHAWMAYRQAGRVDTLREMRG